MPTFNCVFPVLPGKDGVARSFAQELAGPRRRELDDLERRCGVDREIWTLQQTPDGPAILVFFDGDIDKTFATLANATDEFTVWYRAQVFEIGGLDLAADDQPPAEVILDWIAA